MCVRGSLLFYLSMCASCGLFIQTKNGISAISGTRIRTHNHSIMRLLPKPEDQGYLPHPSLNLCLRIEFSMKIFPNKNTLLLVLNRIDIFECKESQMLRCFHSRLKKCELKLKRGNLFKFGISNDTRRGSGNEETVQEMNNLGASVTRYWCKK